MTGTFGFQYFNYIICNFGTLEPWNPGTLEPWNPGTLELFHLSEQTIHKLLPVEYLEIFYFFTQADIFNGYFELV